MAKSYTLNALGTIAVTAGAAHNSAIKAQLPDSTGSNVPCVSANARANVMRTGELMLCQMPDGQLRWHRFDAERSTTANPVVIPV